MAEKDTLLWQLSVSWSLTSLVLNDLSDAECLWEPTANVWTVRPDNAGIWRADFVEPEPDPCPIPTIGWLTWHIGWWLSDVHARCFDDGGFRPQEVEWPGSAGDSRAWLTGLQQQWRESLEEMPEKDFDVPVTSDEWPLSGCRFGQIAAWANVELMKNGAEVGCARRLYAART